MLTSDRNLLEFETKLSVFKKVNIYLMRNLSGITLFQPSRSSSSSLIYL